MNSATSSNGPALYPTTVGYIETDQDKSSIIDACLSGELCHIPRFPQQRELRHLIRSGNIFVFADYPTGSGDWNDGKSWTLVGWENGLRIEREHNRPNALMKKSGTLVHLGVSHHFVCYYKIKHVLNGTLKRPSRNTNLRTDFALSGSGSSPLVLKK